MLMGIDSCIRAQCLVSAVSLIYAAIDGLAALTRPLTHVETDPSVFTAWVDRYLLPESGIPCSAQDLYGARCGILHTYGFDSRRRREGKAKALIYGWRAGPPPNAGVRKLPQGAITVHVEDLYEGLKLAIERFLDAIQNDPDLSSRVEEHRAELVCYRPWSPVEIYVAA